MNVIRYYPRAVTGDGGMTRAVRAAAEAATRFGVRTTILYDGTGAASPPDRPGVRWVAVRHRGPQRLRTPVDLAGHLRGQDVLVLHSAWSWPNVHAGEAARRIGLPYLLEPRGAYDPHIVGRHRLMKTAWWLLHERRLVRDAAAVHVFFDEERPHMRALGYEGPLVVAPNGVDPAGPVATDRRGGYLLWLGRFDPEHKGLDLLLGAIRALPARRRPQVRLHGPDWHGRKAVVRQMVADMCLDPWVHVGDQALGATKRDLLTAATAFAYPSRWEGFGNSVAEAAAVGLPVVTGWYPLGRYLASRGGAVACPHSVSALAAGIDQVMTADAADIGERGRSIVESTMTWDDVARQWADQVERLPL